MPPESAARIPPEIKAELIATGHPWTMTVGSRHIHVRLNNRFCGVLPFSAKAMRRESRATRNLIAQIRRAASKGQP